MGGNSSFCHAPSDSLSNAVAADSTLNDEACLDTKIQSISTQMSISISISINSLAVHAC